MPIIIYVPQACPSGEQASQPCSPGGQACEKSGQPCSSGELLADGDEFIQNEWRSDKPKNLSKNPGNLEGRCDRILREVRFNAKVFIREKSRSIESRVIWRTTTLLKLKVRDMPCCFQSDDPADFRVTS